MSREMLRNAEFKQPDWRLCQEGQEASFPISHIKPFAQGNATEPAHLALACVLLPPAGNWIRFACPISPWFVVSFALSTISTRANWLRSGAFRSRRPPFPADSFGEGFLIPLFGTR